MSRLDEIKARADAATQGPWSFDWSEGEVPVFYGQTTKISGTFSVEANTIEDAEFVEAAREDVPWLVERVRELIGAICWGTTCLNCASLLDSNYDQYMRAEIAEAEVERLTDLCDEFRKREESQDCIRERLTAEVERLERWKFEATEVMSGLRELGKALGLGLGVQITGPAALAEVARLTAERDAAIERLERVIDQWRKTGRAVISEMNRAERAEAERDALAAQVARVESLADEWAGQAPDHYADHIGQQIEDGEDLRAALAEPTGQEGDRPHDCRPIYSRSVCGQCGGQEQWCETCSRQMCGCATDGQEGDHA